MQVIEPWAPSRIGVSPMGDLTHVVSRFSSNNLAFEKRPTVVGDAKMRRRRCSTGSLASPRSSRRQRILALGEPLAKLSRKASSTRPIWLRNPDQLHPVGRLPSRAKSGSKLDAYLRQDATPWRVSRFNVRYRDPPLRFSTSGWGAMKSAPASR